MNASAGSIDDDGDRDFGSCAASAASNPSQAYRLLVAVASEPKAPSTLPVASRP